MQVHGAGIFRHAEIRDGKPYAEGQVGDVTVIDLSSGIALRGVCFAGVVQANAEEGASHRVQLRVLGPDGAEVETLYDDTIELESQSDGVHVGFFAYPLDAVVLRAKGRHVFEVLVGGAPVGDGVPFEVVHTPHTFAVRFRSCVQDQQGKIAGETFLSGRIVMAIEQHGASSPNVVARVKQTVGGDFASDPLELSIDPSHRLLLGSPEFRAAIEQYYRLHAVAGMGGNLGPGVDNVDLGNNLVIADTPTLYFELPQTSSGAW